MPIESIESHSVMPDLIRSNGVVVDCGANLGAFCKIMVRRFGARVIAFEASPSAFEQLPRMRGVTVKNVAVCGQNGPVRLAVNNDITRTTIEGPGVRGTTGIVPVEGRTLTWLLSDAGVTGEIELLKLDIEGAELEVIDSMSDDLLKSIAQITVEFHDFLGYYSGAAAERRIERIKALGFHELWWSKGRNTADVLLVSKRRLGPLRYTVEQDVVRHVRAAGRLVSRRLNWS